MLKRFFTYWLALWLALCWAWVPTDARAADEDKEYLVKAAFIYNFIKFVEWPAGKAISKQPNIDICVVGDSKLIKANEVFKAASTPKLSLTLTEEKNWRNAPSHCHILFISRSEDEKMGSILAGLRDQPVLTVSDIDDFAEQGGMIGFVPSDNKIKIEVNTKSVTAAGMRVDAQLLEIALKVLDK